MLARALSRMPVRIFLFSVSFYRSLARARDGFSSHSLSVRISGSPPAHALPPYSTSLRTCTYCSNRMFSVAVLFGSHPMMLYGYFSFEITVLELDAPAVWSAVAVVLNRFCTSSAALAPLLFAAAGAPAEMPGGASLLDDEASRPTSTTSRTSTDSLLGACSTSSNRVASSCLPHLEPLSLSFLIGVPPVCSRRLSTALRHADWNFLLEFTRLLLRRHNGQALRHAHAWPPCVTAGRHVPRLPQTRGVVARTLSLHQVGNVHRGEVPRRSGVADDFFRFAILVDDLLRYSHLEAARPRVQSSVAQLLRVRPSPRLAPLDDVPLPVQADVLVLQVPVQRAPPHVHRARAAVVAVHVEQRDHHALPALRPGLHVVEEARLRRVVGRVADVRAGRLLGLAAVPPRLDRGAVGVDAVVVALQRVSVEAAELVVHSHAPSAVFAQTLALVRHVLDREVATLGLEVRAV